MNDYIADRINASQWPCGSPSGQHIWDECDCGNDACRRELCAWCEAILDEGVTA